MRAQNDQQEFTQWLLSLGNGELPNIGELDDSIEIPSECNIVQNSIVDDIFDNLSNPIALANMIILTPTNEEALRLNDSVINKMVYVSALEHLRSTLVPTE